LNSKMEGKTLINIKIRENTGCSVVAVKRKEEMMINPDPTIVLERGDELVLIGSAKSEKMFIEKFPAG
jgi:K+/H+ antiporter YhaU regulatory subunit KhtT